MEEGSETIYETKHLHESRGKYFKTAKVTMGNLVFPLLSQVFMASLEEQMEQKEILKDSNC